MGFVHRGRVGWAARVVGGCCSTTPAQLKAIAEVLVGYEPGLIPNSLRDRCRAWPDQHARSRCCALAFGQSFRVAADLVPASAATLTDRLPAAHGAWRLLHLSRLMLIRSARRAMPGGQVIGATP